MDDLRAKYLGMTLEEYQDRKELLRKQAESMKRQNCSNCGCSAYIIEIGPFGNNEAKRVCTSCGYFWDWIAKPENKDKRKSSKFSPRYLGIEYCEICHRPKSMLGKYETLEIHHKVSIKDGGEDIETNILVLCTAHHVWVHHEQTYLNDHFKD